MNDRDYKHEQPPTPKSSHDVQWRFRWELLLWPLGILFGVWAFEQIGVIPHFADIVASWGLRYPRRFAQLACLLTVLSGVLLTLKVMQMGREE